MIIKADAVGIARAAGILAGGGLVAFPTETVYGLGALASDADAVARVYRVKGRPFRNPLITHLPDTDSARALAGSGWNQMAEDLANEFWPGPLTLILPRGAGLADAVTAGGPTMAVRVPDHPVARSLLQACGRPVVAPSANPSGRLSPTLAEHVEADLGDLVDLILDGGPCQAGVESTVVDVTVSPPRLLRPGPIPPGKLEKLLGELAMGPGAEAIARSPGLDKRHYSPRTRMVVAPSGKAAKSRVGAARARGRLARWISFGLPGADVVLPGDPAGAEQGLFAALHRMDDLGLDLIVVVLPPEGPDWLAVRDRLERASGG